MQNATFETGLTARTMASNIQMNVNIAVQTFAQAECPERQLRSVQAPCCMNFHEL